ncbi:prolyl aminopeptidase [Rhodococcus qingshengii]|uniref:prolyl aminopeptidase n=1 Tax=Rhodococcus qingshengii TaxID=334542 RepID=UPI0036D93D69
MSTGKLDNRYPLVEPFKTGVLDVGDGNTIYWEEVGAAQGTPAVFLHGGPGAGCELEIRRYFDPEAYRAVLFDQRGCGRSRPLADDPAVSLSTNTTAHLISDIEALREHLGIDRWVVVGVSWGVTLGLVYAQAYPERVQAMVLGAITTGDRRETDWITSDIARVFPREWEAFATAVPKAERDGDLSAAYARLLANPDPAVRDAAARAWNAWEDTHISLVPDWQPSTHYDARVGSVFARLVTHYWSHGSFLIDGQVVAGMPRLAGIPATLIHGRFDISGPPDIAWTLHQAWPGSELKILDDAGHGGGSFDTELTAALDSFKGI